MFFRFLSLHRELRHQAPIRQGRDLASTVLRALLERRVVEVRVCFLIEARQSQAKLRSRGAPFFQLLPEEQQRLHGLLSLALAQRVRLRLILLAKFPHVFLLLPKSKCDPEGDQASSNLP
jgi:hypothetical protein